MSRLNNTTPPQKEAREIEQWLLSFLDATTAGGKVEPRHVIMERANELMATLGWPGIKKFCEEHHIVYPSAVEKWSVDCPNLPELLRTDKGKEDILDYPNQHPERIGRFQDKITKAIDLALSVSTGQIQDKKEIHDRCVDIIVEGETTTGEATDAE